MVALVIVFTPHVTENLKHQNNTKKYKNKKRKINIGMACQKVCKQGRDDSIKAKVNIKTMLYPSIFFTLQFNSACFPTKKTIGKRMWFWSHSWVTFLPAWDEASVVQQFVIQSVATK